MARGKATGAAVKGIGGQKGRSGRKSKSEELGVKLEVFDKGFTQEDRIEVIQNLVRIAKDGEDKAAVSASSLLFGYVFGKPTEKHEHGGEGGGPIEIVVKHVTKTNRD